MPRTDHCFMIRYDGPDDDREFCIQRGDNWYWTGDGWSEDYAEARLFKDHRTAQTTGTFSSTRSISPSPRGSSR